MCKRVVIVLLLVDCNCSMFPPVVADAFGGLVTGVGVFVAVGSLRVSLLSFLTAVCACLLYVCAAWLCHPAFGWAGFRQAGGPL